jgi:hypothetical protein
LKTLYPLGGKPTFYHLFSHSRVEIITTNEEELKEWQQPYQFFWKVKIKALEKIIKYYPNDDLLYVDSDTFLATDLKEISLKLSQGESFMHIFENYLSTPESSTLKKMYKHLDNKHFGQILINHQSEMWNAGVIGLSHHTSKKIIQSCLEVCDAMCNTQCPRRLIEQFSFSVSLKHFSQLNPCDHIIAHYWGNKNEWMQEIMNFFINAHLKQMTLSEMQNSLSQFDWLKLPLEKKSRSTAEKLKKFIDRLFPIKQPRYFN